MNKKIADTRMRGWLDNAGRPYNTRDPLGLMEVINPREDSFLCFFLFIFEKNEVMKDRIEKKDDKSILTGDNITEYLASFNYANIDDIVICPTKRKSGNNSH